MRFLRNTAFTVAVGSGVFAASLSHADVTLKVASFNIHGPTFNDAQVAPTASAILASGADVVGIQEGSGNLPAIAAALGAGWTYRQFAFDASISDVGILTRLPITQTLKTGVRVEVAPGQEAFLQNIHARAYPYQPYDIRDGIVTNESQAVAAANSARGAEFDTLIGEGDPTKSRGRATFLTGDFNEPSHLDWTQAAVTAGLRPFKVAYPGSTKIAAAGYVDSYRAINPNEVARPGNTWTPMPGPNEVFDRLDFVHAGGTGVTTTATAVVGEANPNTDVVSPGFASDHRLIVSTFNLSSASTARLRTGVNLISNPGAEGQLAGTAATNRAIQDWESATNTAATAQLRGTGATGDYQPATAAGGRAYFYGGVTVAGVETHTVSQTVGLADLIADVDAGRARFTLGGEFGGYADQNDVASLTATFLSAANVSLGTVTIGGVTNADRANVTTLLARGATGDIPLLARNVLFTLTFTKAAGGTYNDGSADNLSFVVDVVPEPATAAVTAAASALVLARRRRVSR